MKMPTHVRIPEVIPISVCDQPIGELPLMEQYRKELEEGGLTVVLAFQNMTQMTLQGVGAQITLTDAKGVEIGLPEVSKVMPRRIVPGRTGEIRVRVPGEAAVLTEVNVGIEVVFEGGGTVEKLGGTPPRKDVWDISVERTG